MMRVTINGKSSKTSLGIRIHPEDWDVKKSRSRRGKFTEDKRVNIFIENSLSKANRAYTSLLDDYDVVTADMVINQLLGRNEGKHQGVVEYYDKYVNELEVLIGKSCSYTLWRKNKTLMKYLVQYLKTKHKSSDIPLTRFSYDHVVGFYNFLRSNKLHAHNTAVKYMTLFKKIITRAFHSGWIKRDPFLGFSLGCEPVERPFLEQHEVEQIMAVNTDKEHLERVRDWFIFSCFTGLAYVDVKKLKRTDVVRTSDGVEWIKTRRTKTNSKSSIPLLPIPKSIIIKYADLDKLNKDDLIFDLYSNQKVNQYLKEVAKMAGVDKNVTFHIARHTFATTVTLQNGIPIETVSKMLGHRSLRTTQHYAKVLDSKISKDMEILRTHHLRIA